MRPINPDSKIQRVLALAQAHPGDWFVFDVKPYPPTDRKMATVAWERRYIREPSLECFVAWVRYVKGVALKDLAP